MPWRARPLMIAAIRVQPIKGGRSGFQPFENKETSMKKMLSCATGLAAGLALSAAAQAQDVTLKFHHIWNTQAMASVQVINPWCEKVAKESANKMKCQVFPAMSMGGTPPQLVDQVKDGVADVVITLPGYTAGRFPALEVFELPFMTNSAEAGARAAGTTCRSTR
jgi:TRAP-type C4-dicarboxylate transport system substrate-binding protein